MTKENAGLKWLINYLFIVNRNSTRGFSLAELLVASVVGTLVTLGVLWLSNDLLQTDRKERGQSRIQQEMAQALDYISSELKQATYVYEGECLASGKFVPDNATTTDDEYKYCPGLANWITFPADVKPVLAFWKQEKVPYNTNQTLPADCSSFSGTNKEQECYQLLTSLRTYTLVVYATREKSDDTWGGPSQIIRYQLRQYENFATLETKPGYSVDPSKDPVNGFDAWPCTSDKTQATGGNCTQAINITAYNNNASTNQDVLIDRIDSANSDPQPLSCDKQGEDIYSASPQTTDPDIAAGSNGFYVCVRRPNVALNIDDPDKPAKSAADAGNTQDVLLFIRGNDKAGNTDPNAKGYTANLSRQVIPRSVFRQQAGNE